MRWLDGITEPMDMGLGGHGRPKSTGSQELDITEATLYA